MCKPGPPPHPPPAAPLPPSATFQLSGSNVLCTRLHSRPSLRFVSQQSTTTSANTTEGFAAKHAHDHRSWALCCTAIAYCGRYLWLSDVCSSPFVSLVLHVPFPRSLNTTTTTRDPGLPLLPFSSLVSLSLLCYVARRER
jgi:hypothetical protein